MDIVFDDMVRVVGDVWQAALGLPVTPGEPPTAGYGPQVVGTVSIRGAYEAEVVLGCDADLARRAAAVMFALPEADVSREQVHDAVGELVNMTGGQLKALLPEGCTLSLPTTADHRSGGESGFHFRSGDASFDVAFLARG